MTHRPTRSRKPVREGAREPSSRLELRASDMAPGAFELLATLEGFGPGEDAGEDNIADDAEDEEFEDDEDGADEDEFDDGAEDDEFAEEDDADDDEFEDDDLDDD